jgi:hypothetical protein
VHKGRLPLKYQENLILLTKQSSLSAFIGNKIIFIVWGQFNIWPFKAKKDIQFFTTYKQPLINLTNQSKPFENEVHRKTQLVRKGIEWLLMGKFCFLSMLDLATLYQLFVRR